MPVPRPLKEIPKLESRIFWYAPGPEPAEPSTAEDRVAVYIPTRAAQYLGDLFANYSRFASAARTETFAANLRGNKSSKPYILALGGEILKPSDDPTDLLAGFTHPAVAVATSAIQELVMRPRPATFDEWIKGVNDRLDQTGVPAGLRQNIQASLIELFSTDFPKSPATFAQVPTTERGGAVRFFMQRLLKGLVTARLTACAQ